MTPNELRAFIFATVDPLMSEMDERIDNLAADQRATEETVERLESEVDNL